MSGPIQYEQPEAAEILPRVYASLDVARRDAQVVLMQPRGGKSWVFKMRMLSEAREQNAPLPKHLKPQGPRPSRLLMNLLGRQS